ncbi:M4 family metallopeptidase [Streptomyces sp. NPDC002073]
MTHPQSTPRTRATTRRPPLLLAATAAAAIAAVAGAALGPQAATAATATGAAPGAVRATDTGAAAATGAAPPAAAAVAVAVAATSKGTGTPIRLIPRSTVTDPDGTVHTRYDRTYAGLPVLGGDLVVHRSADGTARGTTAAVAGPLALPTTTASFAAPAPDARKVVWAGGAGPAVLAWETVRRGLRPDRTPTELHTVTDATTGRLLSAYDTVATGTGHSQYAGTVALGTVFNRPLYEMRDPTRGNQKTLDMLNSPSGGGLFKDADDVWGDGTQRSRQTAGVDAHYAAAATWDFYRQMFGRAGIRNDGAGIVSRVHYGNNYGNAFWDNACACVTYGDGAPGHGPLTTLDVAGHEITHGVLSAIGVPGYTGESAALGEATADVMGASVEFHAANSTDVGDYLIGERALGTPLRSMDRPGRDGVSRDYWSKDIGSIDPHHGSGPAAHFFYLLSEGSGPKVINGVAYDSPTYDGSKLLGIGREQAVRIWYRAMSIYFTSRTTYATARTAMLASAADLYGMNSTQQQAVAAAWTAVNVK